MSMQQLTTLQLKNKSMQQSNAGQLRNKGMKYLTACRFDTRACDNQTAATRKQKSTTINWQQLDYKIMRQLTNINSISRTHNNQIMVTR
jgi:hypothetical protein